MQAHQLRPPRGAKHDRKRIGRGNATGQGTYAGKGLKGQKARSGNDIRIGFEGGQLPLVQRLGRKRGFTNHFRVQYQPVNLARLAGFAAKAEVTAETLKAAGIIKNPRQPIKILGEGDISNALTVRADRVSAEARRKIEAAGGTVEEIGAPRKEKAVKERAPRPASDGEDEAPPPSTAEAPETPSAETPAPAAEAEAPATPARRTRRKAQSSDAPEGAEDPGDAS